MADGSVDGEASVDHELVAGDVAGGVGREEQHRPGDLLRRGDAPERDPLLVGAPNLGRVGVGVHLRVRGARSDRVDRDAVRRELDRERRRQRRDRPLRGDIGAEAGNALAPRDRRDVDDRAAPCRNHPTRRRTATVEVPVQVRAQQAVPVVVRGLHDGPHHQARRVVDPDVDPTPLHGDPLGEAFEDLGVARVSSHEDAVDRSAAIERDPGDARAGLREPADDRLADAARGAGDDDAATGEVEARGHQRNRIAV